MALIEGLQRMFAREPMTSAGWNQPQREALMDLLILGIYVDGKISIQETELLKYAIHDLTEETGQDWDTYAADALKRISEIEGNPEQQRQFVQQISERLGENDKRSRALQELKALLSADGRVPIEEVFLQEVMTIFEPT